jgi:DNA-binding transcriptional LysR family regulator
MSSPRRTTEVPVTLQQIRDVLAVAEHGSLHAAARASGQTQPALTRSIQRLERDLGATLFERHARGVRPNATGRHFLVHARRLAAEADSARDAVAQLAGGRRGSVNFGVSVAASILLVPAAIARFRRAFPQVALHSRGGLYHTLVPALREGELDFVLCPIPHGPTDPQLSVRPLIDTQMVMVARRGHPRAQARSLAAVADAGFVVGGPRGLPGGGIHEVLERAGLGPPRIELRTDGLIDTLAMVAGSDCLALLPSALLRSGLLRESLTVLPLRDALPVYQVGLFERAGAPPTPAAHRLMLELEREVAYGEAPSSTRARRRADEAPAGGAARQCAVAGRSA